MIRNRRAPAPRLRHAVRAALFASATLGAACAWGGFAIDVRLLDRTTETPTPYQTRLIVDGQSFSLDTTSLQGRPSAMLGRNDDALYLLDRRNRTYLSVSLETLGNASALMKTAGDLLPDKLGAMLTPKEAAGPVAVVATGRTRTIAGLPCTLYEVTRAGRKVQELWTTSWNHVAAPPETLDLIRRVAAAWSGLAPIVAAGSGAGQSPQIPVDALLKADGFPVMFSQFANGRVVYEGKFGVPKPVATKPADFTVPSTYTRKLPSVGAN